MELSELYCYPLKSGKGVRFRMAELRPKGLGYDRHWLITDADGQFVTGRTLHPICLIEAQVSAQGLALSAPGMPSIELPFQEFGQQRMSVCVWKDTIDAALAPEQGHQWVSDYLGGDYRLLYMDELADRPVRHHQAHQVGFADGFPVMLVSHQSLELLNQKSQRIFEMQRFRPNLVVNADQPFAEDSWKRIRIGEVELLQVKPCSRCQFITVDPQAATIDPQGEPLRNLRSWRQTEEGEVLFGQNMLVTKPGVIRCGDAVEVLEWREPDTFSVQPDDHEAKQLASVQVLFDDIGRTITADPTLSILQNAELQDISLPSRCRGGQCGVCRIQLEAGEVKVLTDSALTEQEQQQGVILACSCLPRSDLVLRKFKYS